MRFTRAMDSDPYNLQRFVVAQDPLLRQVCAELADGRKRSHWMWFIFPQLRGLGSSLTAQRYALGSLDEARAYLAHPLLGARLRHCTELVNRLEGRSAEEIFGSPDVLKFRSSMTLFVRAASGPREPFAPALAKYFAGEEDSLTRELLNHPRKSRSP
jgi:uncharacterized protein (DUF1810 family)